MAAPIPDPCPRLPPPFDIALLDILRLLAQLLDGCLKLDAQIGQGQIVGLRAERVGLAVELLAQEIEPPSRWLTAEDQGPRLLRVAAAFGRASYSFFLIHFLILIVLSIFPPAPSLPPWPRFFYLCAAGLPLSSLAAIALYLGVELPAWRRLRG